MVFDARLISPLLNWQCALHPVLPLTPLLPSLHKPTSSTIASPKVCQGLPLTNPVTNELEWASEPSHCRTLMSCEAPTLRAWFEDQCLLSSRGAQHLQTEGEPCNYPTTSAMGAEHDGHLIRLQLTAGALVAPCSAISQWCIYAVHVCKFPTQAGKTGMAPLSVSTQLAEYWWVIIPLTA